MDQRIQSRPERILDRIPLEARPAYQRLLAQSGVAPQLRKERWRRGRRRVSGVDDRPERREELVRQALERVRQVGPAAQVTAFDPSLSDLFDRQVVHRDEAVAQRQFVRVGFGETGGVEDAHLDGVDEGLLEGGAQLSPAVLGRRADRIRFWSRGGKSGRIRNVSWSFMGGLDGVPRGTWARSRRKVMRRGPLFDTCS